LFGLPTQNLKNLGNLKTKPEIQKTQNPNKISKKKNNKKEGSLFGLKIILFATFRFDRQSDHYQENNLKKKRKQVQLEKLRKI
jgi:hypothetical protein